MRERVKRIRKKNKKNKQEEKIILILIISIIISLIISVILFKKRIERKSQIENFEKSITSFANKNEKKIFSINKIVFFSNSNSKNKSSNVSNFIIENLYTYTDMAIFINNNSEENVLENTLKTLKICNIKYTKQPEIGQPNIYYKSINDFAKSELKDNNLIQNELDFCVTSKDEEDLSKPILYNNCANPITLSYINQNIKTDYTILDTLNPITYNGTLLKRCEVPIKSIQCSIAFDIYIENNKNEKFKTSVYTEIPYENEDKSIYDGTLTVKKDTNFNFYRYE